MLDLSKNNLLPTAQLVNLCLKGSTWSTWSTWLSNTNKISLTTPVICIHLVTSTHSINTTNVCLKPTWVYLGPLGSTFNLCQLGSICVLKGLLSRLGWAGNAQSRHFLLTYTHMYPKVPKSTLKYQKVPKLGLLGCKTLPAIPSTIAPYHYCHYWRRHWRQQKVRLRLCALIGYGT